MNLDKPVRRSKPRSQGMTGAPHSPKRTWDENDGRSSTNAFAASTRRFFVEGHARPQEQRELVIPDHHKGILRGRVYAQPETDPIERGMERAHGADPGSGAEWPCSSRRLVTPWSMRACPASDIMRNVHKPCLSLRKLPNIPIQVLAKPWTLFGRYEGCQSVRSLTDLLCERPFAHNSRR
jgi:hypothetical protein